MAIAYNTSMEFALNALINTSSSDLFASHILRDVSLIVEKTVLSAKWIINLETESVSYGKNKTSVYYLEMTGMISISTLLTLENPSTTSITSHLPQK
jgi:hypothetical protein